jgi:phasin family protein
MSSITEQFSAATKSQLDAQFQIFSSFASTAVASAEKFIALNISTTKASVEKSSATAKKLLAAKDPQEFFSLSTAEPASFDKLLAYGRELASIASTAQSELIKSAQSTFKQVTELATTPATVVPKTPPALAAAVTAAVSAINTPSPAIVGKTETLPANEPVAAPVSAPTAVAAPKAAKAPAKPKPAAAPIAAQQAPVDAKVTSVKPSFPAPPPKPVALAPESKPAKLKSVATKAKPAPGKQLDMLSGGKGKK